MSEDVPGVQGPSLDAQQLRAEKMQAKRNMLNLEIRQETSKANFVQFAQYNASEIYKNFKSLDDLIKGKPKEEPEEAQKAPPESKGSDQADKTAQKYQARNPELNSQTLISLRAFIKPNDTSDTILQKLIKTYSDPSLADEALDFLIESATKRSEIERQLIRAKEEFNASYGREIRAGKNMALEARQFSKEGLGSPTGLRDLYRDITGNPREPFQLFEELTSAFDFEQMKKVIEFLLHSLGSDMKAKGPSIPAGELSRLFSETRLLQAFLSLYRFFQSRMKMIGKQFDKEDLSMPKRITFQYLAKLFMKLLQERYPSANKVLQLAYALGLTDEIVAQIIIFSQYRDALRQVSPMLFKSERHRQDMIMAFMEALSDLEDELEGEGEEEEEEEEE